METLAEQIALFRAAADASFDWEEWMNADGELGYISPACKRITGYCPEEFLANPRLVEEIVHPDDQALFVSYLDQAAAEPRKSLQMEYRIIHHNGEVRWIDLGYAPVYGLNDEFLGRRISYRDVTDRKRIEEELRQSHQLFEALVDGLTEVVGVADLDGTILLANQVLAQRLEMKLDELVGKNISEVLPPEIAETRRCISNQVIQTGKPMRVQETGKAGIYDSICFPVLNEQGKVEKVAVISYDITELKRTEEELRKSEEKYRFLAENSNDVIWNTDANLKPIFISPSIEKLRGYTVEEAMKQPFETTLTPSSLIHARDALQAKIEKEKSGVLDMTGVEPVHLEYTCKDGSTVWVENSISMVRDSNGKLIGFMGVARDITERKRAEEALQKSEQLLRTVINNAPVIIAAIDKQGVITLAEGKFPAAIGFESGDLVGKNAFELIGNLPESAKQLQRIMAGEEFSDQYISKLGAVFEFRYKPMFDQQNNFTGAIMVAVDVTEYARAQEALRQSRNQLEVILNGVADSVVAMGIDGFLVFANRAAGSRLNYPSGGALVQDKEFLESLEFFDEAGKPLAGDLRPWIPALNGIICPPTTIRYRKKGFPQERWVVMQSTPIFDERGKVQMEVTISHDISELKYAQQELQKARDELERRVEVRTLELAQANQQLREEIEMRKQAEITIRQKAAHAEALARVAARLNTKLDLKSVLQSICNETASAINFPGCALMLLNEETDCLEMAGNTLRPYPDYAVSISREMYEGFLEAFGPVIFIPDLPNLPNVPYPELIVKRQTRTILSVPLNYNGNLIGCLTASSLGEVHLPTDDEMNLLKGFADQASIAIANARLFEEISESHKHLQALSERLVKIQEEERRMLARELHDEIGQMLTSLSLSCDIILKSLQEDETDLPKITTQFERAKQMLNQLVTQVRKLSLELRPGILDDLGLLPALLDHFERYSSQTNIKVRFKHHGLEGRYSTDVETTAFRIAQEALTNVARHAKVDNVSVHLWVNRGLLTLKVEDQGVGFDLEAVEKANTSVGISSMRERSILCGGELEIETMPGRGTCLTAELPLDIDSTRSKDVHHYSAR